MTNSAPPKALSSVEGSVTSPRTNSTSRPPSAAPGRTSTARTDSPPAATAPTTLAPTCPHDPLTIKLIRSLPQHLSFAPLVSLALEGTAPNSGNDYQQF